MSRHHLPPASALRRWPFLFPSWCVILAPKEEFTWTQQLFHRSSVPVPCSCPL
nr:MAG TPA: hypothetical protein [Caudoviricetes sp.]